jgi:hypothetical protein
MAFLKIKLYSPEAVQNALGESYDSSRSSEDEQKRRLSMNPMSTITP